MHIDNKITYLLAPKNDGNHRQSSTSFENDRQQAQASNSRKRNFAFCVLIKEGTSSLCAKCNT